jgi:hypothetical protein
MSNEIHRIKRNRKLEYHCYNNTTDSYLIDKKGRVFDNIEACIEYLAACEENNQKGWTKKERIAWWENYLAHDFSVSCSDPPHWKPFPHYDLDAFIELVSQLSTGEKQIVGLEPPELRVFQKVAAYLSNEAKLAEKQPSKRFDFEKFRNITHRLIGSEGLVVEAVMAGKRQVTALEETLWATLRYLTNVERVYNDI